ncbi:exodeoxyribonuclease VII large subunit [Candidatus Methylospira mobilis]|uniref:Exodeoxyribonuclease 7 large subunit n=1 Tax=Candidatus Methylospira mobilis TaxID=1808979 RepID=A0A5Q0BEI5_9GAMM|nr:exodeoxyribonuclease VII large subunit [Candidatus Methylospira mobilis]QFY42283.1 exodeoxyribonuclease VII large subunit [Candidatus Methylospira mobilis]WNV04006.1 exodeoxyribonuclease VII large subunit [Candidatus Methylospira mobilis]
MKTVLSVSELNSSARLILSSHFGTIWVSGEISNLTRASSGHLYFTLKDRDAQVRCAMFRGSAKGLCCDPRNGLQAVVRAQVSLYEPRGDYQLIIDYLEDAGAGDLRIAYEALKQKLMREGLFSAERKRSLPPLPHSIGIVTSPQGAAIHDILTVLKRRFPAIPVVLFPARVQGAEASAEVVNAIARANMSGLCDVLIVARGGGSLEDLWTFNEESVARAIHASMIPVITGVGHETDITIADLVADVRAPTPSAAAETVVPDAREWHERFVLCEMRLTARMKAILQAQARQNFFLQKRLQLAHPRSGMQRHAQRLDMLELRLSHAHAKIRRERTTRLEGAGRRLQQHQPGITIQARLSLLDELEKRRHTAVNNLLSRNKSGLNTALAALHAISPLATLGRGYSVSMRKSDGHILRAPDEIRTGALIETRLAGGVLVSRVETGRES